MSANRKKSPAEVQGAFDELFNSFSDEELLEQEGRMIGFAFLNEVEQVLETRNKTRKDLAKDMGISGSFLTQLFTGEKPLSDKHKAMFQRVLGIRFAVTAQEDAAYKVEPEFTFPEVKASAPWEVIRNFHPDYSARSTGRPGYNENQAA